MPQPTDADRIALAEAWIDQDPDPQTRDECSAIVERVRAGDAAASADLADRFDARLEFGTAGLRGEITPRLAPAAQIAACEARRRARWFPSQPPRFPASGERRAAK